MVELHDIVRWLVLRTALAAIVGLVLVRARGAWDGGTEWLARSYVIAISAQVLLGLVVWVIQGRWGGDDAFLSWLHPLMGLVATGLAHAGVGRARKAEDPRRGATVGLALVVASVVLVVLAVPRGAWPL